ncbi:MAG: hypothetical protein O2955_03700 [Planctomycetota bacterium]|nr:hypothetical protein [Planctomycetota bacterium]MDA1211592.1 hypothetical protein [Planctomycetota bacterium]
MSFAVVVSLLVNSIAGIEIEAEIDFGPDRGQNYGTIFEARDESGRVRLGAGFVGVYNTRYRTDRETLQFFVRPAKNDAAEKIDVTPLPRSGEDGGAYPFNFTGRLFARSFDSDPVLRWWNPDNKAWELDDEFSSFVEDRGGQLTSVAGKTLWFDGGIVKYDGEVILDAPDVGRYYNFYYAQGHLSWYHAHKVDVGGFTKLHAVPWDPKSGEKIDLDKAITHDLEKVGETPFAWGQYREQVLTVSNHGGIYVFENGMWKTALPNKTSGSRQVYSMLNFGDELLLAEYPSGHIWNWDGETITERDNWPPQMPNVASYAREAQTSTIYRGELFVGVWPWAELWRYDRDENEWQFVRRMFSKPEPSDKVGHPWEAEIMQYNAKHGTELVYNNWGHRVTGLIPMESALYLTTSAKGTPQRDTRFDWLTDDVWEEYGRPYRLELPGNLAVQVGWQEKPVRLKFELDDGVMRVYINGELAGEAQAPVDAIKLEKAGIKKLKFTLGKGIFGPGKVGIGDRSTKSD